MNTKSFFPKKMPPTIQEVRVYFFQKGISEKEADNFFQFYEKKHWTSKKGTFFKNWKGIAYKWIASVLRNQSYLFDRHIH